MRAYVTTSGTIFGLLVAAHVWRIVVEGWGVVDPFLAASTMVAAALAAWAWQVLKRARLTSPEPPPHA